MTLYPGDIDTDLQIPRIEDNITEIGGVAINALREAVFTIEETLGVNPQKSITNVSSFLDVSHNADGTIKPSSLTSIGLVSLPITSSMFNDYTIPEVKLILDHSTANLYSMIVTANVNISNLNVSIADYATRLMDHFSGYDAYDGMGGYDGYFGRHVASHIDINDGYLGGGSSHYTGIDPRDTGYTNTGLRDKSGAIRSAKTIMDALLQINNDYLSHALSLDGYHSASFVSLNTSGFSSIPSNIDDVQKFANFIDNLQENVTNKHNVLQHSNGIPRLSNVELAYVDGYNKYFGPFDAIASINSSYESVVTFSSPYTGALNTAFSELKVGDILRINYGGFLSNYVINNFEYTPSSVYNVYLDGYHLAEGSVSVIIEKSQFDDNSFGKLAITACNHNCTTLDSAPSYSPSSIVVIPPNAAMICGMNLDLSKLDENHHYLYVAFYPRGNPSVENIIYPALQRIDVTGNNGTTPGAYTLSEVIRNVNLSLRSSGINMRMAAFDYKGQFGLALTDNVDNAAFSIISGTSSTSAGEFVFNVVDIVNPTMDPLGLGPLNANVATQKYVDTNSTTNVIVSRKLKDYVVNGTVLDYLARGYNTNNDGYYSGQLTNTFVVGGTRLAATYRIEQDIENKNLVPGSTITVLPMDYLGSYSATDHGRFIIDSIDTTCDGYSFVNVISLPSFSGNALSSTVVPPQNVRIYFGSDCVNVPKQVANSKVNFEIYVKSNGETFAHKRAYLPLQSGSGTLLDTTSGINIKTNVGWHIHQVSPKLSGRIRSGSVTTEKYVRFVVENHNTSTGMYEGWICQATTSTGTSLLRGKTVLSRIGDVGRYYDINGVDYIDISFDATALGFSGPGSYRYVDIQIFDSLRFNENYMVLGCFEQLNFNSESTIWNILDLRNFGNTSEKQLSTTAIKLIESGDRLLHANGVFNGFDYDSLGTTSIGFKGGSCLVDGVVVNKDDFVAQFYNVYSGSITEIKFAVCLDSNGNVQLLPFDTYLHYEDVVYASGATGRISFYTLQYINQHRKDLLPLYVVTLNVNSSVYSIASYEDIRRFVSNNEYKENLVLYSSSDGSNTFEAFGSFSSWHAVANYAVYSGLSNSVIRVKGYTNLVTTDLGPVDFRGKAVTIIGESGNTVNVIGTQSGILLNSNMIIDGLNFVRQLTATGASTQTFAENAANKSELLLDFASTQASPVLYQNIEIKNCSFTSNVISRECSFIKFIHRGDGGRLVNVKISNNRFNNDSGGWQNCICFANTNGASISGAPTSEGCLLSGVYVENNVANAGGKILFTSNNVSEGSRGLCTHSVFVRNNVFGNLHVNVSKYRDVESNQLAVYPHLYSGFIVDNNTFVSCLGTTFSGAWVDNYSTYQSSKMQISNNRLSYLILFVSKDSNNNVEPCIITNNVFNYKYEQILKTYGLDRFKPIQIAGSAHSVSKKTDIVTISNNGFYNGDYTGSPNGYEAGIDVIGVNSVITNNILDNLLRDDAGTPNAYPMIYCRIQDTSELASFIVKNNTLIRNNSTMWAYIEVDGLPLSDPPKGFKYVDISENIFDKEDCYLTFEPINIQNLKTDNYTGLNVRNNKNQKFEIDLSSNFITGLDNDPYNGNAKICLHYNAENKSFTTYLGSEYFSNGTYEIEPFGLQMPYIYGAKVKNVSFTINTNLSFNLKAKISSDIFTQLISSGSTNISIDIPSTQYFNNVSSNISEGWSLKVCNYSYLLTVYFTSPPYDGFVDVSKSGIATFDYIEITNLKATMVW